MHFAVKLFSKNFFKYASLAKMFYARLVGVLLITEILLIVTGARTLSHFNLTVPRGNEALSQRVCDIAAQVDASVNLVYFNQCTQNYTLYHLEQKLIACMAKLPSFALQLENYKKELSRGYDSLSVFFLAGHNATHIKWITDMLNAKQQRKQYHKYIFVWRNADEKQLQKLFEAVWAKHILDAIAVTSAEAIYTFEPFTAAGFVVKRRRIGGPYFYDKLKNLQHYQLRISMFRDFLRAVPKTAPQVGYSGVDGLMATSLVLQLNATVKYIAPADNENYGACLENGTFTGVLRDLIAGTTDVNFNAQFVLPCAAEHIETLYPYLKRILYVVVPAAEMFPDYLIFIYAYKDSLWRALLIFFFVIIAIFALLKWTIERLRNVEKMKDACWYDLIELFWKVQLGVPVDRFSNTNTLRQFLMAWILFNYVMTSIYFAKVESIFVHASYYPEIDRLDDLHTLNVPIFGVQNIFTAIEPALKPAHWRTIEQHGVHLPLQFSSFQFAVPLSKRKHWRVAFLLRGEAAKDLLVKTYDAEHRRPRFHVVKEHLHAMPQTYLLPKGSPFRYKFEQFESRVLESGIFEYWSRNALHQRNNVHSPNLEEFRNELPNDLNFELKEIDSADDVEEKVVLNMRILQGPFYVWGFGMLFSFISFVLEHAYCCYWRPRAIVV